MLRNVTECYIAAVGLAECRTSPPRSTQKPGLKAWASSEVGSHVLRNVQRRSGMFSAERVLEKRTQTNPRKRAENLRREFQTRIRPSVARSRVTKRTHCLSRDVREADHRRSRLRVGDRLNRGQKRVKKGSIRVGLGSVFRARIGRSAGRAGSWGRAVCEAFFDDPRVATIRSERVTVVAQEVVRLAAAKHSARHRDALVADAERESAPPADAQFFEVFLEEDQAVSHPADRPGQSGCLRPWSGMSTLRSVSTSS